MAQEIGSAYVTILPSTRGFGRAVENEFSGSVDRGGKKGGGKFLAGVGKWSKRAGALGVAVAAGFVLKGGISRAMALDDAEAKLRGLGLAAEDISSVMDNAPGAVKGTAFGLGDAATAAASATAAGIKPGKELERYLTLIGDAATIGGTSFNEMGSIINKTTARGKVGMENLNQLTERGIPILGWLADEYGVSGEELSKMVSRGEVDAKTFRKVIEDNIGGAAQESGKTIRGSLANTQAALGRLGESLVGPGFERLPGFLARLTAGIDKMAPVAKVVGEAISVGFEKVGKVLRVADPAIKDFLSQFGGDGSGQALELWEKLKGAIEVWWDYASTVFEIVKTVAMELWEQFGPQILDSISWTFENLMTIIG